MTQKIEIVEESAKPVEELYAILADHERLSSVFGTTVRRVKDGEDGNVNGVGSVRRLVAVGIEETITGLTPNRLIEYRITKGGAPMRNHRGRVEFSGSPGKSTIRWTIEFDMPPLLDVLMKYVLGFVIRRGVRGIT
jgi:uncharacterized membrane protein